MTAQVDIATVEDVDRAVYLALFDQVQKAGLPTEFYEVFGHQPDAKVKAKLDDHVPLLWIKRIGAGRRSDVVGGRDLMTRKTGEVMGVPTYESVKSGQAHDLEYEVRYITFHESDERAIVAQMGTIFPFDGFELKGPSDEGYFFERLFTAEVPGERENELGGLLRIEAQHVWIGDRIDVASVPAITDLQTDYQLG